MTGLEDGRQSAHRRDELLQGLEGGAYRRSSGIEGTGGVASREVTLDPAGPGELVLRELEELVDLWGCLHGVLRSAELE